MPKGVWFCRPVPSQGCALPGTLEWRRERERKEMGIALPDDHREMLDAIAADLGIGPPAWRG